MLVAPSTASTAESPGRGGPTWAVVGGAAILAAGLAAAAVAFLGARSDQDTTVTSASTVPAEDGSSSDADAGRGAAAPTETPDGVDAPDEGGQIAPDEPTGDPAPLDGVDAPDEGGQIAPDEPTGDPAPLDDSEGIVDGAQNVAAAADDPGGTSDPDATVPAEAADSTDEPAGDDAPASAESDAADDTSVPESRAVIRNGQIYLEGAVPTQAASDEIEALAAEVLGPQNVFNNYIIDERAGDPSLGNITVEDTINFATGSSVLLPESEGLLNQGLALMTIRPAVIIEIVGHTDDRGSEEYNQQLSEDRAASVKRWFVERGVDANRLITSGAGEGQPIADNSTEEGRRLNRRIQLFLQNILGDG